MKTAALALLLVLAAQDAPPKPCDLAKVEDGSWCARCSKVLRKTEKASDVDKDGKCAACGSAPDAIKVCVKEWVPRCGMHDMQPHDKPCCTSRMCCKMETVASPVTFTCEGCGASASLEAKLEHKAGEHEKKLKRSCAHSGRFPHGGELPKPKDPAKDAPPAK